MTDLSSGPGFVGQNRGLSWLEMLAKSTRGFITFSPDFGTSPASRVGRNMAP